MFFESALAGVVPAAVVVFVVVADLSSHATVVQFRREHAKLIYLAACKSSLSQRGLFRHATRRR